MKPPVNSGAKQAGRFKPGQSGNPAGRPAGARHKAVEALDLLGRKAAAEIIEAVIEAAKGGDARCAELVLRRIWPEVKSRPVQINLPKVTDAASVTDALARVVKAAAAGEITVDEAQALTTLIEGQRRAIETTTLEARIAALEAKHGNPE